jgi:hypothetical protein
VLTGHRGGQLQSAQRIRLSQLCRSQSSVSDGAVHYLMPHGSEERPRFWVGEY